MSRPAKVVVGLLTIWPLVYMAGFMVTVLSIFVSAVGARHGHAPEFPAWMGAIFVLHLLTMLLSLGLTVFYAVNAYRSPNVPESRRVIWILLVILGAFVGQLVYWYLFIWREPEPLATAVVGQGRGPG